MGEKKLLRALAGEAVWPPPIWLMRQAGRYLPEYRAVRDNAGGFIALCTTPELASEVTLQPVRRFGMDGAILFSDILMVPWALGQGLHFAEGEGPVLPPLRSAADLAALDLGRVAEAIQPILQTVRLTRAALGETATLIGFAGGPFTVACYMVEGSGSKNFNNIRAMAYGEPALFARLMDMVTEATIGYLSAQIAAGAEVVMLFDSWAGILSPSLFARHVIAPSRRIVAELAARHPAIKVIGFPRLAGVQIARYASETGVAAVAMDTAADPAMVRRLVPETLALQGNLDPAALITGGTPLAEEADALLHAMRGHPFIFNLGHGIEQHTPPEHVAELVERVRHA